MFSRIRRCSDVCVEPDRIVEILLIGPSLGDAADEFEGAEGVEAQTAVFPQNDGLFVFDGFCDGLGVPFFLNAAGVEEEDLLSGREVSLRELQDALVEFGVIDAGGETDQVISRKVGGVGFDCVDEGDVEAPGNGVQYFFVLPWWAE